MSSNSDTDLPLAYREGTAEFLGCTIYLDSRPLIPRTETEWWVEEFLKTLPERGMLKVLDLFSGSGCVGVAVLKHVQSATVDFGELEARHLPTIQKNIDANGVGGRSQVIQTDVYSNSAGAYDYILANPPYLAESRIGRIDESVLMHEPKEALMAAEDGFALIRATIEGAPAHLNPGGQLWVEHEPEHAAQIATLAASLGMSATAHNDQYGVCRYSVILKP